MGEGEVTLQLLPAPFPHGAGEERVGEQAQEGRRQRTGQVGGVHQESGDAVANHFRHTTSAGADAGLGVLHGFQKNDAEALLGAGQDEEVAGSVVGRQEAGGHGARQNDFGGESEMLREVEEVLALGAVADNHVEGVGDLAQDLGQGGNHLLHILVALGGLEPGDGEEHRPGGQTEGGAVSLDVGGLGVKRIQSIGEDAEEGGVEAVEARHFALREGADAEDAVEAAGAQPLQTGQGLPDLDAVGDQAFE